MKKNAGGAIAGMGLLVVAVLKICAHFGDDLVRVSARSVDDIARGMGRTVDDIAGGMGSHVDTIGRGVGHFDGALGRLGSTGTESTIAHTGQHGAREGSRSSLRVVAIAPSDDLTFTRMFGKRYTSSAKRQMDDFVKQISVLDDQVAIFSEASKTIEDFRNVFSEMSGKTLVITGHSVGDDGARFLILPNGQRISVDVLGDLAEKKGKSCIFVTCHSSDLGLARNIRFDDAGRLIARLGKAEVKDSPEAIRAYLQTEYKRLRLKSRISVTVVGVGGVAGGTYALGGRD